MRLRKVRGMEVVTEFEVIQSQLVRIDHAKEVDADFELAELEADEDISVDVQAEIGWAEGSQTELTGSFGCTLQTAEHLVSVLVKSSAEGLSTRDAEPQPGLDLKNRMFSLVYPHLRGLMVNVGRIADLPVSGMPLSVQGLIETSSGQ